MAYLLIVDDDLDFATAVARVLSQEGHETAIETDAAKAVERIEQRRPEAVILDVMFPEDDTAGFDVARTIRRTFGPLPVVLLTAVNQQFPLGFSPRDLDAKWLPAVDFLEKPIDFARLTATVNAILARHQPHPTSPDEAPG